MKKFNEITLEMSLKPFKKNDKEYIEQVCHNLFQQWHPLIKNTDIVSVLLWIGDGSELLEYSGDIHETIEWAKYIGRANIHECDWNKSKDPERLSPHASRYLYIEEPPIFTYEDLKNIVSIIKKIGKDRLNKPIKVGTTFDPGPEFAVSRFKYEWHPEICAAGTMGSKSFVVSYETLHEDHHIYKAYPKGIPEGTPFATFLGKQANEFLKDMSFDYLWMSNGFGFGAENWAVTGPLFDGVTFTRSTDKIQDVKDKTVAFWQLFRKECPDYEVQTRGTNLSVGIDFATDGVATQQIYEGNFNIVPPPNSPWAALDKNFGLEMTGYMSRIAELPDDRSYMYRFYLHDPWWLNSPWFDRYEGEPHDIYLPLAVSRIDHQQIIGNPKYLNLLTVDTSLGELPDEAVNTVTPHLLKAYGQSPDKAAPFVWIYPFKEYQNKDQAIDSYNINKSFYEDWLLTAAINTGLPLNTVVSTDAFCASETNNIDFYKGSILLTPVPYKDSDFERVILKYIEQGGNVLFYGSLTNAGTDILSLLHIKFDQGIKGEIDQTIMMKENFKQEYISQTIYHNEHLSDGCIDTIMKDNAEHTEVLVHVEQNGLKRITGVSHQANGKVVWLRGSNSATVKEGSNLLVPHDANQYFNCGQLLRYALQQFDYHLEFIKRDPLSLCPALTIHRYLNAFHFSGYVPDTTVGIKMRFPLGVPVFIGHEVYLEDGYGIYHMPRSFTRECRVFVSQNNNGPISMSEYGPVSIIMKRRVLLEGLKDATIYVFPEEGKEHKCELLLNSVKPNVIGEEFICTLIQTPWGKAYKAEHITGNIMYSMEFDEQNYLEKKRGN